MKKFVSNFNAGMAGIALLTFTAGGLLAQDSVAQPVGQPAAQTSQPSGPPPANPPPAAPPLTLSYGVSQVVQLSKANIGEPTIVAYVQSSGNSFNLDANQIVYLKQQGVSDGVVKAMLDQKNRPGAVSAPAPLDYSGTAQPQVAAPATPAPIIVQQQPSSSVYVIPDTQTYYFNAYDPYYYGYYGWGAPVVGIGWGFGWGGGYGHGWYGGGGYHGGGWGGGYHGGGGHP
jgi:hypothetical protein